MEEKERDKNLTENQETNEENDSNKDENKEDSENKEDVEIDMIGSENGDENKEDSEKKEDVEIDMVGSENEKKEMVDGDKVDDNKNDVKLDDEGDLGKENIKESKEIEELFGDDAKSDSDVSEEVDMLAALQKNEENKVEDNNDIEYYSEDSDEDDRKKKKRKKDDDSNDGERPKKKKKKNNKEDSEEDEQVKKRRVYEDEFNNIKQSITVRRKKKNHATINDDEVKDFIKRMYEADTNDGVLLENNQPAIQKLSLIEELVNRLAKKLLHQKYVDGGILLVFRNWLLPQGNQLPILKIRSTILNLLSKMNIKEEAIMSSQINQIVKILAKHQKETVENKKLANLLLKKWSNPLSVDYRRHFKSKKSVTSSKKKTNKNEENNSNPKQLSGLQEVLKNMEKGTKTRSKQQTTMGVTKLTS